jgi:hypothetical protein
MSTCIMARHDNARTKGNTDRGDATLPVSLFCGQLASDSHTGAKVLAQSAFARTPLIPIVPANGKQPRPRQRSWRRSPIWPGPTPASRTWKH